MAHMCFRNLTFSKHIIGKVLKSIGFSSDESITSLLNIIEQIAWVKDEF
jgi:hypothetical protein